MPSPLLIRRLVPGAIASAAVAGAASVISVACGGSTIDEEPPAQIAPEAGPPQRPPPDAGADDDAAVADRDFETTLVSDEPGAEVQLAVSSTGRIVVAWIGLGGGSSATIRYAISDDAGKTFTSPKTAGASVGDPIVAALDDGSFLVGGLRADCSGGIEECSDGEIFLAKIAPGAAVAEALPSIREPPNDAFIDHPWMTVHDGAVSIIGAVFPIVSGSYESGMTAWRSVDRGATWQRSEIVAANATSIIGIPRFCANDGTHVWAHYYDAESSSEGTLRFDQRDADAGADAGDWPAANAVPVGGPASGLVSEGGCAVRGDTVYALVGTPDPGGPGGAESETPVFEDIHLVASSDLGATWRELSVIREPDSLYLLPEISIEPDGTVDVFYYHGTEDDGPATAELVRVADGGKSPGEPLVVRDEQSFVSDRASQRWLGDYNGIGYAAGKPIVAFGDNSTTKTRVRFGRLR